MAVSDETRRALREMGLTDYESRAYLILLTLGTMNASQLSNLADLPYSKVYNVLKSLERKGWINVEDGRPKIYHPKPPSEALEAMRLRLEANLRDSSKRALEGLQPLYQRTGLSEKSNIWIVRGEFNILAKMKETLNESRREVMLAVPALPKPLVDTLITNLAHLKSRRVEVRLMTTPGLDRRVLMELSRLGEVRMRDRMFGGGLISDSMRVMLLLGGDEESLAIWADHTGLTGLSKEYFEYLWKDAKALEQP